MLLLWRWLTWVLWSEAGRWDDIYQRMEEAGQDAEMLGTSEAQKHSRVLSSGPCEGPESYSGTSRDKALSSSRCCKKAHAEAS